MLDPLYFPFSIYSIEKHSKVELYYKDCWQDFMKRFEVFRKEFVRSKDVN